MGGPLTTCSGKSDAGSCQYDDVMEPLASGGSDESFGGSDSQVTVETLRDSNAS